MQQALFRLTFHGTAFRADIVLSVDMLLRADIVLSADIVALWNEIKIVKIKFIFAICTMPAKPSASPASTKELITPARHPTVTSFRQF